MGMQSPPPPPPGGYPAYSAAPAPPSPGYPPGYPPAYPPRPTSRMRRGLVTALAALLIGGIAVAGAAVFFFMRGSGDTLLSMTPSNSALYVTVYLDPAGSQKVNANNLIAKFPKAGTQDQRDQLVNNWMDKALAGSGLDHSDVRSWLGNQIAFVAGADALKDGFFGRQQRDVFCNISNGLDAGSTATPPPSGCAGASATPEPAFAVLIAGKSDSAAQRALDKAKNHSSATDWKTENSAGITVTYSEQGHIALAITHHTVILASTSDEADAIIKTADGKSANLGSDGTFKSTDSQLPSDRLAFAYLNASAVAGALPDSTPSSTRAQLAAYRGIGAALSAQSDGAQVDFTMDFDPSKLTSAQRALLGAGHANAALPFVPSTAYGFLTLTHIDQILASAGETLSSLSGGGNGDPLESFGLTGPDGVVHHLSGDAGLWVAPDPETSGGTGGALLLGTSDDGAVAQYITSLPSKLGCTTPVGDACPQTTDTYKGTTLTTIDFGSAKVSWAIYHHMLVVATSSAAVQRAMDAQDGDNVTTAPTYKAVAGHVPGNGSNEVYIDVPAIASAIKAVTGDTASWDANVDPWVRHVGGMILSTTNSSDHVTSRLFVAIN